MYCVRLVFWMVCLTVAAGVAAQTPSAAQKPAAPAYNPALLTPEKLTEKAPETFDAKFTTTKGDFVIRVTREWAPVGADRFYNLVKNGYYNGNSFFRVVPGFVVQWGMSAHPEVTKAWQQSRIQDDPVKGTNTKGFVTFAKGGPNSRTTQVYINLRDNTRLDAMAFAPFGQVVEGMEVVEKLYGEYGDGARGTGPQQNRIAAEGNAYLEKEFPLLDSIKSAVIVAPAPAAPAPAKKTPAPPKK